MGNLCSSLKKPSAADDDPFARPGRVLGSTPQKPAEPRASIPKTTQSGQKLGGSPLPASASTAGGGGGEGDARTAAAKAAEERAARAQRQSTGKLGKDLASQKAMTRNDTLAATSEEERRRREVDTSTDARNYN